MFFAVAIQLRDVQLSVSKYQNSVKVKASLQEMSDWTKALARRGFQILHLNVE